MRLLGLCVLLYSLCVQFALASRSRVLKDKLQPLTAVEKLVITPIYVKSTPSLPSSTDVYLRDISDDRPFIYKPPADLEQREKKVAQREQIDKMEHELSKKNSQAAQYLTQSKKSLERALTYQSNQDNEKAEKMTRQAQQTAAKAVDTAIEVKQTAQELLDENPRISRSRTDVIKIQDSISKANDIQTNAENADKTAQYLQEQIEVSQTTQETDDVVHVPNTSSGTAPSSSTDEQSDDVWHQQTIDALKKRAKLLDEEDKLDEEARKKPLAQRDAQEKEKASQEEHAKTGVKRANARLREAAFRLHVSPLIAELLQMKKTLRGIQVVNLQNRQQRNRLSALLHDQLNGLKLKSLGLDQLSRSLQQNQQSVRNRLTLLQQRAQTLSERLAQHPEILAALAMKLSAPRHAVHNGTISANTTHISNLTSHSNMTHRPRHTEEEEKEEDREDREESDEDDEEERSDESLDWTADEPSASPKKLKASADVSMGDRVRVLVADLEKRLLPLEERVLGTSNAVTRNKNSQEFDKQVDATRPDIMKVDLAGNENHDILPDGFAQKYTSLKDARGALSGVDMPLALESVLQKPYLAKSLLTRHEK